MRRRRIDARTVASHVAIWGLPTASDSESGSMSATESGHEFSSDGDASDSDDRVVAGGGGALELSPPPASPSTMPDALEPELEPLTRARGWQRGACAILERALGKRWAAAHAVTTRTAATASPARGQGAPG